MRQKTEKMKLSEQGIVREEALLAYVNNELSAEEKQKLEKLLKEDPFAQEALEGLQQASKTSAATVININKKVRVRSGLKEGKTIQLHWTNYAWAAVVFGLLIGIGFLMVTFISKPDNSIAMNKKAEEPVNVMEQKVNEPSLAPVTSSAVTDSLSVNEQQKVVADESSEKPTQELETKQPDDKKVVNATKQQTVTSTGGVAAPSPTISLLENNANAMGKTSAPITVAKANDKGKEETSTNNLRLATGDAESAKAKEAVKKEESKKKNLEQRREDNTPAAQTIMRGSVMETEAPNKVTVISMDDAMKSFNGGDYKTSSEQFGEILKQQPNNADALYFGGISEYINGNAKKSEKNFDKLLKDGTKFTEGSKWYKANLLLKKGKKDEAKKILDELSNSGGSYKERAVKKKAEMEF